MFPYVPFCSVFLFLFANVSSIPAQEAYQIKMKMNPPVGKSIRIEYDISTKFTTKAKNGEKADSKTKQDYFVIRETVLEHPKGENKPTRLKRFYEKAIYTVDDEQQSYGLEGKTVLIEKKGPIYQFRLEQGGALGEEEKNLLNNQLNGSNNDVTKLVPDRPVTAKESWKVGQDILKQFGKGLGKIDTERSSGSGKLLKVYQKGQKQYGKLEWRLKLIGKSHVPVKAAPENKAEMDVQYDGCIDGSRIDVSTTADMRLSFFGGSAFLEVTLKGNLTEINGK